MPYSVLKQDGGALVAPEELTIHLVEGLRDDLIAALRDEGGEGPITIVLDGVRVVDTAALQVLLSARRTAATGRGVAFERPAGPVVELAAQLGLEQPLFGAER